MSTNWLERARREISNTPGQGAANAAERTLTAATAAPQPAVSEFFEPRVIESSPTADDVFIDVDPERLRRLRERAASTLEARRRKVLDMLAAAPETVRYAWHADDRVDPHYVVVALAIRDVGTCELSIAKDRYDPGKLVEIIDGAAKEASERG